MKFRASKLEALFPGFSLMIKFKINFRNKIY